MTLLFVKDVVTVGFIGLLYGRLYCVRALVTGLLKVGLLKDVWWSTVGLFGNGLTNEFDMAVWV